MHNLEHGGIVVLDRCDVPCPDLVAALAWRRVEELPASDRTRLLRFYETHVDRGPEDAS